ncbi:MAG: single-stranded-DNA-specific exonuclease RecJ, partial [Lentisphaerae bacterium]|nr:single-stranded-DNA-specific exonuclease RecJ [Lentisphaerota bacterium]
MEERTWEFANIDIDHVLELIDEASVSRPVALVLAARDINAAKVHDFLNPDLANISDPYLLPGTRMAAERLWQAVDKEELIVIHGDYDTDGITASALLASILRKNGARVECYLPHRIDDGYGLTAESIARA